MFVEKVIKLFRQGFQKKKLLLLSFYGILQLTNFRVWKYWMIQRTWLKTMNKNKHENDFETKHNKTDNKQTFHLNTKTSYQWN